MNKETIYCPHCDELLELDFETQDVYDGSEIDFKCPECNNFFYVRIDFYPEFTAIRHPLKKG